jgi:hypothetical protein
MKIPDLLKIPELQLNPAALLLDEWRELYETDDAKALRASILRSVHERLKETPMKVAVCKVNPNHNRFRCKATVIEEWIVDRNGTYKERGEESNDEVFEEPRPGSVEFLCDECDALRPALALEKYEFMARLMQHDPVAAAIESLREAIRAAESARHAANPTEACLPALQATLASLTNIAKEKTP